jgi:hypothetical protein
MSRTKPCPARFGWIVAGLIAMGVLYGVLPARATSPGSNFTGATQKENAQPATDILIPPVFQPLPAGSNLPESSPATLPPPHPPAPPIPSGTVPTRYCRARPGMRVVLRIYPETGPTATQTTEVLDIDEEAIRARQTVQTGSRPYAYDLTFSRYAEPDLARRQAGMLGRAIGTTLIEAAGSRLVCIVYEHRGQGDIRYRTLYCPDIFEGTVRHEDNAKKAWKTRMELIEWTP